MNYSTKSELIQSLAESMGAVDLYDTKPSGVARFDSNTGTLYCEGVKLPHSSIEEIKTWHKQQMDIYKKQSHEDSQKMEYYMRFAVAYNAICMMEDNLS